MQPFLQICLLTLATLLATSTLNADEKPNFVVIYIDDMGYGDIGPYGSKLNQTPTLDRMAAEGMKLTSFYAAPVCSASRAQLLTGSYAPRVGVPGVFFPASSRGLNPKEHTVAEYLRDLGYTTMCVGKWHLGDHPEFLPNNHGFDGYFGIPYSNDMGRVAEATGQSVHPLVRDTKVAKLITDQEQRQVTRAYTEEAVTFIDRASKQKKPFFLYFAHTAMHVPIYPHPDFVGQSTNGAYGDWVAEVDWSVTKVLDALRDRKLDRNTLVLFTSDNGPWASKGKNGGVSGPLRGSKGGTLEGGVRVPTIAWWPGRIKAGSTSDAITGTTDVLPTLVAMAGGQVRGDVKIDGQNIAPLLLGESGASPQRAWFYYQRTRLQAVRRGPWKLAVTAQSLGMGIREKPNDLRETPRLYNLDQEIGEQTNLADQHPEIVKQLQLLIDAMTADIGSGKPGPGVRPAGHVANPTTLYPTRGRRSPARPRGKPINWKTIKHGDAVAAASAPNVAGQPLTIAITLKLEQAADGVVLAHGGAAVGYAVYVKDDRIVFAIRRTSNDNAIERVSVAAPSDRTWPITATLSKDGRMSLRIGDGQPATRKTTGLLPRHPQEDFCVGHDNANPVDPQAPSRGVRGHVTAIVVTTGEAADSGKAAK